MKFWEGIITKNLSHKKAEEQIKKWHPYYSTRPEWNGVHFYSKDGVYCILFNDGHIETDMLEKIWDKDKNDWMIVTITDVAVDILKEHNLI